MDLKLWSPTLYDLLLLQILFHQLCFSQQVRDELFVRLGKPTECFHVADEFLGKPQMLLIAPALAEMAELSRNGSGFFVDFFVESSQHLCESPKFARINYCLCHEVSALPVVFEFRSTNRLPA